MKLTFSMAMLICLVPFLGTSAAQQVNMTPGISTIPTARFVQDRNFVVGVAYLPPKYAILRDPDFGDRIFYLTLGFLPFVETTLAVVRSESVGNAWGVGDRVVNFRFKLVSERSYFPAIVLGLHDPLGFIGERAAQHFNATYLAASKLIDLYGGGKVDIHAGYSSDMMPAAQYQFVGFFGGLDWQPIPTSTMFFEYDGYKFSSGWRVQLFKNVQGMISLFGMDRLGGSLSYRLRI